MRKLIAALAAVFVALFSASVLWGLPPPGHVSAQQAECWELQGQDSSTAGPAENYYGMILNRFYGGPEPGMRLKYLISAVDNGFGQHDDAQKTQKGERHAQAVDNGFGQPRASPTLRTAGARQATHRGA